MASLIVGAGFPADHVRDGLQRSGVQVARAASLEDAAPLLRTRAFDQVVVMPGAAHGPSLRAGRGPAWLWCVWAGRDPSPARRGEVAPGTTTRFALPAVFGRGADDNVTRLARSIRRWRLAVPVADPGRLVQPIHVEDLVALVAAHALAPSPGEFAVRGSEAMPVAEIVEGVVEILGLRAIGSRVASQVARALHRRGVVPGVPIDWHEAAGPVDTACVRSRFDWTPQPFGTMLEQAVHEAIG